MNHTKGRFDRIEHIAAILVSMHFGLAFTVATTLFSILQQAMHKTKQDMVYLIQSMATNSDLLQE